MAYSSNQRIGAEFIGSAFLLATVIGSGIMAERLAGGNEAIALLGNTLPTGAMLIVLITMLGPISGAHFNPAVTLAFLLKREAPFSEAFFYIAAQIIGALSGVALAHVMFDMPLMQLSTKIRGGFAQGVSEWVATFGLLLTILLTRRAKPEAVATTVGLYIVAAYWFTASTSFANPAVTIARACSDTFAGIRLADAPLFIAAQIAGAICALAAANILLSGETSATSPPAQTAR